MSRIVMSLALVTGLASVAEAQSSDSDALLLARVCVHEAGFDSTEDCSAIAVVLRRLAERQNAPFARAAFAYSGRALRGLTRRSYVAQLDATGARPRGWSRGLDWEGDYRARWLELLAYCERVLRGEERSDCAEPPDDWGGRMDRERAQRLGLVEVDCGETRNDFYRRPSSIRAEREAQRQPEEDGEE